MSKKLILELLASAITITATLCACNNTHNSTAPNDVKEETFGSLLHFLESDDLHEIMIVSEAKDSLYNILYALTPEDQSDRGLRTLSKDSQTFESGYYQSLATEDPQSFHNWLKKESSEILYSYYIRVEQSIDNSTPLIISKEDIISDSRMSKAERATLLLIVSELERGFYNDLQLRSANGSNKSTEECYQDYELAIKRCDRDFLVHGAIGVTAGCIGGGVGVACAVAAVWAEHMLCYHDAQEDYHRCVKRNK